MHHRVRAQLQLLGVGVHALPHVGQSAVFTVANGDHEVLADEDHHLAGFDDLAGQCHRFVRDVIDGLQHQEQCVVVSLQLGPLVGVHGVLDRQGVQPEHIGHFLHVGLVWLVQPDPDERLLVRRLLRHLLLHQFDLAHLAQRRRVGVVTAGQPLAIDVHAAVDEGFGRWRDGVNVLLVNPGLRDRSKWLRQRIKPRGHGS